MKIARPCHRARKALNWVEFSATALMSADCLCLKAYSSLVSCQVSQGLLTFLSLPPFLLTELWTGQHSREIANTFILEKGVPSSPSSVLKVWSCGRIEWELRTFPPPTNQFTLGFQWFTKPQRWFASKSHSGRREIKTDLMEMRLCLQLPRLPAVCSYSGMFLTPFDHWGLCTRSPGQSRSRGEIL